MAEEPTQAPAEEQETPAPEATQETSTEAPEQPEQQTQAEIDFEQRYNDLRPEYDRSQQLLAALQGRHGPEAQQEAAQLFGFEFAEDDTPDNDELPPDPDERIEKLEQMFAQQEQAAQAEQAQEAFLIDVNDGIEAIEKKEGRTISDAETQFILAQAEAQLRSGGDLDIEAAYAPISEMSKTAVDRYLKSKKQAQSAPSGSAGDRQIDTSTPEGRRAAIQEIAAQSFSSED